MKTHTDFIQFSSIGFLYTSKQNPYETPRQGTANAIESTAIIELNAGNNFEQALTGLDGFSHLWVIYLFDRNTNWNPMVMPPRGSKQKLGVFATRAPYRPNNIGISVVEIKKIEGLEIHIANHDLLDGTPILDIKPYLPYSDSFPEAKIGWLENIELERYSVRFSSEAQMKLQFLEDNGVSEFRPFLIQQLEFDPTNSKKKRISKVGDQFIIAYRTWRAQFEIEKTEKTQKIIVQNIFSGYTEAELDQDEDTYRDKELHRKFLKLSSK